MHYFLSSQPILTFVFRLGMHAFHRVLTRKPTAYGALLPHLARELRRPAAVVMAHRLRKVVGAPGNEFIEGPTWKR